MYVALNDELALYLDGGRGKLHREGICRMCLRPHAGAPGSPRWLTRHHLVPQSWCDDHGIQFRVRDAEANIIPLCGSCHRAVEREAAARRMLRKVLTQTEIAFAIQLAGKSWFDYRYQGRGRAAKPRRSSVPALKGTPRARRELTVV